MVNRHQQREKERETALLALEHDMLQANVDLLLKAIRSPASMTEIEKAWVATLTHSSAGPALASQCALSK